MKRLLTIGLLAALALGAAGIGFVAGQGQTEEVRVNARSLANGKIEFAIEHDGERLLPTGRFLTAALKNAGDGKWLRSTPVEIEVRAEPQVAQVEADDAKEFKIGNSDHVGIRLTILTEILLDGHSFYDPVGWAKASVAAGVVNEICDDFERPESTDAACDQLLIAIVTPFNQSTPVLSESMSRLREIVSRRDVENARGWATWDEDIYRFYWPADVRAALASLRPPLERVQQHRQCGYWSGWDGVSTARAVLGLLGTDTESTIVYFATEELREAMRKLDEADSGSICSLDASHALRSLGELGF